MEDSRDEALNAFLNMRLSEAIRKSVTECRRIEQIDNTGIPLEEQIYLDMRKWLRKDEGGVCYMCMAGVVLRGAVPDPASGKSINPDALPYGVRDRVYALNLIRTGEIKTAVLLWSGQEPVDYSSIAQDIAKWLHETVLRCRPADHLPWDDYDRLAGILESGGL